MGTYAYVKPAGRVCIGGMLMGETLTAVLLMGMELILMAVIAVTLSSGLKKI